MKSAIVLQQVADVAAVAAAVYRRTDEVSILLARAITREVRLYGPTAAVPFDIVAAGCAANMRAIFGAIAAGDDFDVTAATRLGVEQARYGMPLSSVMEAYRVGFRRVWETVAAEATSRLCINGDALRTLTAKLLTAQDLFTNAMAAGYRQEQTRRVVDDETQRFMLIDALMHGRLFERCSLWEAADYLRLPSTGPFVVIAADIVRFGVDALPDIEAKLRSLDVSSAWQGLPDVQVGIVHVNNDRHLAAVLALVTRVAIARVGVSARFDDLRDTPRGLRQAR
ncbi:MAG: PucR family transcriptional regulator, partial [Mycobacterium sp.]